MNNSPPVVWKFKKWQYIKSTGERTQQLEDLFIAEEQKSSTSGHIEGIMEWKKACNFCSTSRWNVPVTRLLRNVFLRDLLFQHCTSMPFWLNNFIFKDWVSWLVFLEDKRSNLLMERQIAVIILACFPPLLCAVSPESTAEVWFLNKYVFKTLTTSTACSSFLPLFSVA